MELQQRSDDPDSVTNKSYSSCPVHLFVNTIRPQLFGNFGNMGGLIPKRAIKSPQKLAKIFTKSLPIFLNEGFPKGGDAIWEKFPNTPVILSASLKVIGHFAHFGIIFGQLLPHFAIKFLKIVKCIRIYEQ